MDRISALLAGAILLGTGGAISVADAPPDRVIPPFTRHLTAVVRICFADGCVDVLSPVTPGTRLDECTMAVAPMIGPRGSGGWITRAYCQEEDPSSEERR